MNDKKNYIEYMELWLAKNVLQVWKKLLFYEEFFLFVN